MNELLLRRRRMVEEDDKPYLRFTALEDNSSVAFGIGAGTPTERTLSYSKNGGTWLDYTTDDIITIDEDEYIEFRRRGSVITQLNTTTASYYKFKMTGKIAVSGNIMSLLDASLKSSTMNAYCFLSLFQDETSLITAEDLLLPAVTGGGYGYSYYRMFYRCSSMVKGLKEIPLINCKVRDMASMFQSCTSLTDSPYVKATSVGSAGMESMFMSCSKITSFHFSTLGTNSSNMLRGCSSANYLIMDATTPPTISSSSLFQLSSSCIIYVPDESVQTYKEARYWSARADYIRGISEKPTT